MPTVDIVLGDVQFALISMYKDVKEILERHDIRFYVQFGTAIGALRHDGFIPWDDDIDLLVWEDDLPRINKVLSEELDRELYYYHIPTSDTHPHVIFRGDDLQRGLKERDAPFIDLFPLCRYPSTKARSSLANVFIWGNVGSIWAIDHVDSISMHRVISWIPSVFKKLADRMVDCDSDMTVVYATEFKDYIFPQSFFGEPVMHVFEDTEVPLPCEVDAMLTAIYGDYMTPPPEDKRIGAGGFPCCAYIDYVLEQSRD